VGDVQLLTLHSLILNTGSLVVSAFAKVFSFTLDVPDNVTVADQFLVKWSWLATKPDAVVIVQNDVAKNSGCRSDSSAVDQREGSFVVLNLKDGNGSIGFYVSHPG
jgi:hypothetical protein